MIKRLNKLKTKGVLKKKHTIYFNFKYRIVLCCIVFSMQCHVFSQNKASHQEMNRLIRIYSEDAVDTIQSKSIPPPPPLIDNISIDNRCEKIYNIPDSLFLGLYPFDADSIVIAYPDTCCDSFSKYGDYQDFFKLGKMEKKNIAYFASQLYNYNYIDRKDSHVIVKHIDQIRRPDIVFLFYHNHVQNTLALYFDECPQLRIETTFSELYWGAECSDLYNRLIYFFKEEYDFTIKKCREYIAPVPPILPLIENKKLDN